MRWVGHSATTRASTATTPGRPRSSGAGAAARSSMRAGGLGEVIALVNRRLAVASGAYADHATVTQLREQRALAIRWGKELAEAHMDGRAAAWLERWEGGMTAGASLHTNGIVVRQLEP